MQSFRIDSNIIRERHLRAQSILQVACTFQGVLGQSHRFSYACSATRPGWAAVAGQIAEDITLTVQ